MRWLLSLLQLLRLLRINLNQVLRLLLMLLLNLLLCRVVRRCVSRRAADVPYPAVAAVFAAPDSAACSAFPLLLLVPFAPTSRLPYWSRHAVRPPGGRLDVPGEGLEALSGRLETLSERAGGL